MSPWHAYLILLRPGRVQRHLDALFAAELIPAVPTLWQIELGVLRMWHRVLFRSETIGTCATHPVRSTRRARWLENRFLRGPFLFWERAIAPLDHSGLAQPTWRLVRHLLAAHHDGNQFAYDLHILRAHPDALDAVEEQAHAVLTEDSRRSRWLRDLVVYDRYHEHLLDSVQRAKRGEPLLLPHEEDDPDISFPAYVRWCLAQPATPLETWRAWRAGCFPRPLLSPAEVAP